VLSLFDVKSRPGFQAAFLCSSLDNTVRNIYTAEQSKISMLAMARTNQVIKNYFGSKNGSGVYQQIINQIRPHDVYMELFAGSGAIAQYKKAAGKGTFINDIDPHVFDKWNSSTIDMNDCVISNLNAVDLLQNFNFSTELQYCIYLDPPYPLQSRRSDREVYRHEMTDEQHRELLWLVCMISADYENIDFLISTYDNPIYSEMLEDWQVHSFQAQTRKGPARELLYMNYASPKVLHQYNYLGTDYIDRQRIKRKIDREIQKLLSLPATERNAIVSAVLYLA
jgi:16S rRNA G966 N2-methylase RsmD